LANESRLSLVPLQEPEPVVSEHTPELRVQKAFVQQTAEEQSEFEEAIMHLIEELVDRAMTKSEQAAENTANLGDGGPTAR